MLNSARIRNGLTPVMPYRVLSPALAGCLLFIASLLPWLHDPLGASWSAWQLPVDIGWQLRTSLLNYGMLCLGCAFYTFYVTYLSWRSYQAGRLNYQDSEIISRIQDTITHGRQAGLLCLLILIIFGLQVLFVDMELIAQFWRNEIQAYYIKASFGYNQSPRFLPIVPAQFDYASLAGRGTFLINYMGIGLFFILCSTFLLLFIDKLYPLAILREGSQRLYRLRSILAGSVIALILLGRAPMASLCVNMADTALASGNYKDALSHLSRASWLNPYWNSLATFHIKEGQALYYLQPDHPTAQSHVYMAFSHQQQKDFFASYQELLLARQQGEQASWLVDETSWRLTQLAEMAHPFRGTGAARAKNQPTALTWLQTLHYTDPHNIYAQYGIARILYEIQDYTECERKMLDVVRKSHSNEIQSSAYTYIGLSRAQKGDRVTARDYFFLAQKLDPEYRNNTARQGLSGLR